MAKNILFLYDLKDTWICRLLKDLRHAGHNITEGLTTDYSGLGKELPDLVVQYEKSSECNADPALTERIVEDIHSSSHPVKMLVCVNRLCSYKLGRGAEFKQHLQELGRGNWSYEEGPILSDRITGLL